MFLLSHMLTVVLGLHLRELLLFPLQDGGTALISASKKGHETVVKTLLQGGARVDIQNKAVHVCLPLETRCCPIYESTAVSCNHRFLNPMVSTNLLTPQPMDHSV